MIILFDTLLYVINAPYFWGSMGFTVAMAMLIGAYIFDGNIDDAKKGVAVVSSYGMMIVWLMLCRIYDTTNGFKTLHFSSRPELAFAGIVTVLCVTVAWLFGLVLGVFILRHRKSLTRL